MLITKLISNLIIKVGILFCLIMVSSVQQKGYARTSHTPSKWDVGYITYYIDSYVPSTWHDAITEGVTPWFNYIPINPQRYYDTSGYKLKISYSSSSTLFPNGEIGITYTYSSGGIIDSSIVYLNKNKTFTTSTSGSGYHVQSVILHEIGHVLGLDHVGNPYWFDNEDTEAHVMFYADTGVKTTLHPHDIQGVQAKY